MYERIIEDAANLTINFIMEEMAKNLQDFDKNWVTYEQIYVLELMLIEADARLFITEAIETDKELTAIENKEKTHGRIQIENVRHSSLRRKDQLSG